MKRKLFITKAPGWRNAITLRIHIFIAVAVGMNLLLGCGGGQKASTSSLSITHQPADETVPIGSPASFSVTATGVGEIAYQWYRDGQLVAGATQNTYTFQPVVSSDGGSTFTVAVSGGGNSVKSRAAVLSDGARSPAPGDLRFQQVGANSTSQGFVASYLTNQSAPGQNAFPNQFGSPLSVGPGCIGVPTTPASGVYDCGYLIYGFSSSMSVGLTAFYNSNYLEGLPLFLSQINHLDIVVTGLSLNKSFDEYGASWIQGSDSSRFDLQEITVPASDLAATLQQEGKKSRVVTALSFDGADATLLSYGWSSDSTTVYETTSLTTTFAGAATSATQLAQSGYIITAIGGSYSNGIILVGTRVQGDSQPRALITSTSSVQGLTANGYALVGLLVMPTGQISLFVGEK